MSDEMIPGQSKVTDCLATWQSRAQALRQKREFCRRHQFPLEQRCLQQQVELLEAVLLDLQVALLPDGGHPALPATPATLPDVELSFLAELLDQAADLVGRRVSTDVASATIARLTPAERVWLMNWYVLWNSGERKREDYFMGQLDGWLRFYAARFRSAAAGEAA